MGCHSVDEFKVLGPFETMLSTSNNPTLLNFTLY